MNIFLNTLKKHFNMEEQEYDNPDQAFQEGFNSGYILAEHDPKATQEISDFTISMWEVNTSKTDKYARDRFIAWNQVAAEIIFAFPHWGKECIEYGKHILSLFTAFLEEHHHLIFSYDWAMCKWAALPQDLLLTDLAKFGDLPVFFYGTLFCTAVLTHTVILTHIAAIMITIPYQQGDSNSWIQLAYGMAQGCILTVRSTALAIYA